MYCKLKLTTKDGIQLETTYNHIINDLAGYDQVYAIGLYVSNAIAPVLLVGAENAEEAIEEVYKYMKWEPEEGVEIEENITFLCRCHIEPLIIKGNPTGPNDIKLGYRCSIKTNPSNIGSFHQVKKWDKVTYIIEPSTCSLSVIYQTAALLYATIHKLTHDEYTYTTLLHDFVFTSDELKEIFTIDMMKAKPVKQLYSICDYYYNQLCPTSEALSHKLSEVVTNEK